MKKKHIIVIAIIGLIFVSCNEEAWLKEKPLSFYSPENSFVVERDFHAAVVRLYDRMGNALYNINSGEQRALQYPTDILYDGIAVEHDLNYYSDKMFPNTGEVQSMWNNLYKIISDANVVLNRIESEIVEINDIAVKNRFIAEAKFFRAFSYRTLGILFGGVPITTEETQSAKRDFTRATKKEVFSFCEEDLLYAIAHLPTIDNLDEEGRVTKAAAQHLLTEVYLILENWEKAIEMSTNVIDNPNFELMQERFGTRSSEDGDVYWDLFRRDNQNRSSGNRESILVRQYEYNIDGGSFSQVYPRFLGPLYWQLSDDEGVPLFIGPTVHHGGRGIGWFVANPYLLETVWEGAQGDIRNSEFNIYRDIKSDNPSSKYFGQPIVASGAIKNFNDPLKRYWSALFIKTIPINNFPDEVVANPKTGLTTSAANGTYTDSYIFRLAETYLLRSEAFIGKGDIQSAANDINIVRARAQAPLVDATNVDLNYLLDERARELAFEELRLLTLMRTGTFVERVKKYNIVTQDNVSDHQNLWPIPEKEIESNTEAVIQQNPGY